MENFMHETPHSSRREILKKSTAFVVPTVLSFKMSELSNAASGDRTLKGVQFEPRDTKKPKTKKLKIKKNKK